jgi:hypothetical protein
MKSLTCKAEELKSVAYKELQDSGIGLFNIGGKVLFEVRDINGKVLSYPIFYLYAQKKKLYYRYAAIINKLSPTTAFRRAFTNFKKYLENIPG